AEPPLPPLLPLPLRPSAGYTTDQLEKCSACSADPEPVAVRVTKLNFTSVRLLANWLTEFGRNRGHVFHSEEQQGVGPGVAFVLRQEHLRPVARDRHECRHASREPVLPFFGEPQSLIPRNRHLGVSHTNNRNDLGCHWPTLSLTRPAVPRGYHR